MDWGEVPLVKNGRKQILGNKAAGLARSHGNNISYSSFESSYQYLAHFLAANNRQSSRLSE